MARPEVTGQKLQQTDNIPFDERLFTSKQAREILCEGKTKFFDESLPQLDFFLDGNRHKITGRSIQALIKKRLAVGRLRRSMPQGFRKSKDHIEPQHDGGAR
jgi:hypothetical protein